MSEIQNPEILEVVPGFSHDQLEGWIPPLATEEEIRGALEKAFDYRGDVTITLKNGTQVEGYIFDRQNGPTLADSARAGVSEELRFKALDPLFGNPSAGVYRTRHGRGQKLGSLAAEILGEEDCRRAQHPA